MNYKPLRMNPGDTDVVVRTEVTQPGRAPVQIDYSMEKTPDGWKAYDVIVAGVSLVTNYRDEFNDLVKSSRHRRPDQGAGGQEQGSGDAMNRDTLLRRAHSGRRSGCAFAPRENPQFAAGDRWLLAGAAHGRHRRQRAGIKPRGAAARDGRRRPWPASTESTRPRSRSCSPGGGGRRRGRRACRSPRVPPSLAALAELYGVEELISRPCLESRPEPRAAIAAARLPRDTRCRDRQCCAPLRRACRRSPASTSWSRRASSSACSAPTAPARRR